MISYKLLKRNGLEPKSITKNKKSYIVETKDNKKYVLKEEQKQPDYNYLLSRNFNYFPSNFNIEDYTVYEYIENSNVSEEEQLTDIIDLISLLHTKTTRYKNIDIDNYKIIYEDLLEQIETINNYYIDLNNIIDNELYMSPSNYFLVRNISKIYSAINFSKQELNNWYELIKENPKSRFSYIHNNLELDHLIISDNPYLISWDKSTIDFPINDLYNLYKKYYNYNNFDVLLNRYQKRYPLKEEELKLFFIKISIPYKIELNENELNNTQKIKELISYLNAGDNLIRPYYNIKKED